MSIAGETSECVLCSYADFHSNFIKQDIINHAGDLKVFTVLNNSTSNSGLEGRAGVA